jgi:predicted RNase H-like HicB family nuclease
MEKDVNYYMGLRYTVELKPSRGGYRASIKEIPECGATVSASESIEELWQLLEENQREWIEETLELGWEVPGPPSATRPPFWEEFEEVNPGYEWEDVRSTLYEYGVACFPLRLLEELWLQELQDVRLSMVGPREAPPKAKTHRGDQRWPELKGDVHPVSLGKGKKKAWIKFDGLRTKDGYRGIEVLDKPLRTEAAIVAALTVLEASRIEDFDFERLRDALYEYVKAHPGLKDKNLQEVLDELPWSWFLNRKAEIDQELDQLDKRLKALKDKKSKEHTSEEKRDQNRLNKHLPKTYWRWERSPAFWVHSIRYLLSLARYRKPDFEDYTLRKQIYFLDEHRKATNEFLEAQRDHMAFLEYGSPTGAPKRIVELARDQVKAAVLSDVGKRSHKEIANILGVAVDEDKYKVGSRIPKIQALLREGRSLLDDALKGTGEWKRRAEEMRTEADRYNSLSQDDKLIEYYAEVTGHTAEQVRSFYQRSGESPSSFMPFDFSYPWG